MSLANLRQAYHHCICRDIIRVMADQSVTGYLNFADGSSRASRAIAWGIAKRLAYNPNSGSIKGQTCGDLFETVTLGFLRDAFEQLQHLRPGRWHYANDLMISRFDQYEHLLELQRISQENSSIAVALGTDYIVRPDIVIGRWSVPDEEINRYQKIIDPTTHLAETHALARGKQLSSATHLARQHLL